MPEILWCSHWRKDCPEFSFIELSGMTFPRGKKEMKFLSIIIFGIGIGVAW